MKPTIGRRVWLWVGVESGIGAVILDKLQALDAGVVFVNPTGTVNLDVTDHQGNKAFAAGVELHEPKESDCHYADGDKRLFATWMPYQVDKAKAELASELGKVASMASTATIKQAPPPAPTPAPTAAAPAPTPAPAAGGSTR